MGEENKGRVSAGQKILERSQTEENLDSTVPWMEAPPKMFAAAVQIGVKTPRMGTSC